MSRRIHFFDSEKNDIICGTPSAKSHMRCCRNRNNSDQYRSPKSTTCQENVTCIRCKELLAKKFQYFVCPQCNERSKSFILVENVLEKSTVCAHEKSRRIKKQVLERKLISIICPVCNKETPATQNWHDINIELRH